jgi:hypothetical protein
MELLIKNLAWMIGVLLIGKPQKYVYTFGTLYSRELENTVFLY